MIAFAENLPKNQVLMDKVKDFLYRGQNVLIMPALGRWPWRRSSITEAPDGENQTKEVVSRG